jgi:hypothetical protein
MLTAKHIGAVGAMLTRRQSLRFQTETLPVGARRRRTGRASFSVARDPAWPLPAGATYPAGRIPPLYEDDHLRLLLAIS